MKKLNHATKYTIIICIGLVIFNLIFGYVLLTESAKAMRDQIDGRMLDISNTAAAMINGDDIKKLTADDKDSPEYQRVLDILTYFQDNIALEYIYCILQTGEKEFVFGIDPTVNDPGEFGSPIVYTDALYNASKGKASVDREPYEDEWGKFYSAYSPIYDSMGNVAGIVAVDFSASWYQDQIKHLSLIVIGFMTFALICSIVMAILIASQYRKFFMSLISKMNELAVGIESLIHEVASESDNRPTTSLTGTKNQKGMKDSIDLLGEKINVMQERLTRQLEDMRAHAYVDGLTHLNNRTSYEEYICLLETRMKENQDLVYSVIVFDINQLKVINDDYGHEKGDELIVSIAGDIRESFDGHRIYRIGGDEFVCIFDGADTSAGVAKMREIIARKNQESPILHNTQFDVGVSIGAATYDSSMDKSYMDVFNRADAAMYADKRAFYQTHEDRRKRRG